MSRTGYWVLGLVFFFCGASVVSADKFGSGLSNDYMTQDASVNLKRQPMSVPAPTVTTSPVVQQQAPLATPTIAVPTVTLPASSTGATFPAAPSTPSIINTLKPKISVPNFEEQFRKLVRAQEEKLLKKKKTLIESITNEISNYGMLIVLALVILIVLYAIHKDKQTGPSQAEKAEEGKKTLWDDEF